MFSSCIGIALARSAGIFVSALPCNAGTLSFLFCGHWGPPCLSTPDLPYQMGCVLKPAPCILEYIQASHGWACYGGKWSLISGANHLVLMSTNWAEPPWPYQWPHQCFRTSCPRTCIPLYKAPISEGATWDPEIFEVATGIALSSDRSDFI